MKNISSFWPVRFTRSLTGLMLLLATASTAPAQTLTIRGTGGSSTANDVTAYVDKVELVRVSTGATVTGALTNAGFETPVMGNGNFQYMPAGATWTFLNYTGITAAGSGFQTPSIPEGNQVALIQNPGNGSVGNNSISQPLTLPAGTYQVRFLTTQRTYYSVIYDQGLVVTVGGVQVGTVTPPANGTYLSYTTAQFAIDASGNVTTPNNALNFDGASSIVRGTNNLPATGEFTLEGWVNPTAFGGSLNAFVLADNFPAGAMHCQFYGNNLGFTINGNSPTDVISTSALPLGQWSHVAVVYSASAKTVRFYVNGALNTTGNYTTAIAVAALPYSVGAWYSGGPQRPFNGKYDEVRMYSAALTQAQVQADMYSTTSALPASLAAYYNFDQGVAGGTNPAVTTLNDQSGNGRTGTLQNFTLSGATSNWVRSFPTITSITPTSGGVGTSVLVTGTNLLDATGFAFNGTATTPFTTPANDFSATVTAPTGTTTGAVSVSAASLSMYNGPVFTAYPNLVVSAFQQIPSGSYNNITITGTGFGYQTSTQSLQVFGTFLIQPSGSYNGNGTPVTGSGSFALTRRAYLGVNSANGISASGATGDIQVTGSRYFSPDAKYAYTGQVAQVTGSGMPSQVNSLMIYNQSTVTFSNSVAVRNTLEYYNGTVPNRPAGITVTLLSNQDSTASVKYAGTAYPGTYTVQRYVKGDVNAGPGYRHFSAPVAGATVASLATSGFAPVLTTSYNTSATPGTTTPFPTVFGYDESRLLTATNDLSAFDKGYVVPAGSTTALNAGVGYAVQMPAAQTVNFVGTIRTGAVAVPLTRGPSADAGWNLVGNPFAATYNMSALATTTGVDNAKYVFTSAGPYVGTYRTYLPGTGGSADIGSGLVSLGQAFFTRVSTGSTSATLSMNSNNTVNSDNTVFHRTTAETRPLLALTLATAAGQLDETTLYQETAATAGLDASYDAVKLTNPSGLNLSQAAAGTALAIQALPVFTRATVVPLNVGVPAAGPYLLQASSLLNLPVGLDAFLRDAATGQVVNLTQQPAHSFSVSATEAATTITGRFTLTFAPRRALANTATFTAAEVALYPNPAHESFTVFVPAVTAAALVQADLLNALGQTVRTQTAILPATGTRLVVTTSGLAAGVYTLRLRAGAAVLAKRVVIQ